MPRGTPTRDDIEFHADARKKRKGSASGRPVPFATFRCVELEKLFQDRYGEQLPDDDAGRDDAEIMLHHLARRTLKPDQINWLMNDWLDRRAPWLADSERDELIARVIVNPLRFTADKLGTRLRLTAACRRRLGITTIGDTETTAEQRQQARAERKVSQKRYKRRAAGSKTRAEYLATALTAQKPWVALGISRATYFRRLNKVDKPTTNAKPGVAA